MAELAELREQLFRQRNRTVERLGRLTQDDLLRPTQWRQQQVEVRFALYRVINHQLEHAVHLTKILRSLGVAPSEAQLIMGRLQAVYGDLEALLAGVKDEDLDRAPASGEYTIRQLLQHVMEAEESFIKRIEDAVAAKPRD